MRIRSCCNQRGITLLDLLVALVIFGIVSAGSYHLFIAQSRAYAVQDQVVEIQQNIRTAMDTLVRDIRMAGFDNDRTPLITIPVDHTVIPGDHSITIRYEYDATTQYSIRYWREGTTLFQQLTTTLNDGVNPQVSNARPRDALLENVDALNFSYGVNLLIGGNVDGMVDQWETDSTKIGNNKIVAVRVQLTARPDPTNNPDYVQTMVSPRTLESIVALRNLTLKN